MAECIEQFPPSEPPVTGSLEDALTDCNGNLSLRVVVCGEKDFAQNILCAPDGTPVAVQTVWDHETNTNVTSYWDLVLGATWAGAPADLTACPDVDVESDPQEMCDSGTSFIRWVVKKDGQPTGVFYDTDLNAAPYTPVGAVSFGACAADTFVPHQNGCIERTTFGTPFSCQSGVSNFTLSDTDLVDFTVVSNDGNGNYTVIQETVPSAHATFLTISQLMAQDNTRTVEDIGGFLQFNFWEGNISNVIDLSPTEVQLDIHVEPGVTDTPDALITPCTDPVADATYQSSAALLKSIYDSYAVGVPQPNGGTPINFVITGYEQVGTTTVTHIPAKQIIKDTSSGLVDSYYEPGTMAPIVFDPLTDVFKNVCVEQHIEIVPLCDQTEPKLVDSTVAAWIMNPDVSDVYDLCDVVTSTLTGIITLVITGTDVKFDFSGITATNWSGPFWLIEFGNGYSDIGGNPSFDFINEPDGKYEIKIYRVYISPSGLKNVLATAVEVVKTGSSIVVTTTNPSPVNRSIEHSVQTVKQNYCSGVPFGSPYLSDGSVATVQGVLSFDCPVFPDEWLGVHDANNPSSTAPLVLQSGGVSIANGVYVGLLDPDGNTWNAPVGLRSVTVRARKGTSTDAYPGNPNQVVVHTALNKFVVLLDETFSWSAEDANTLSVSHVETIGDAAAAISWVEG